MRRILSCLLCAALLVAPARAESDTPSCSAQSAILMEAESGRILFEKDIHTRRPIASITKLMTALVAVECGKDLDEPVEIRREWTGAEGSSMYLKAGERLTLRTLLYGLMLVSGNDAAVAIANVCAGDLDTFVCWMNDKAADLGMENSHFCNPNGLHADEHYSTAYDMAILARNVLANDALAEIVATKSIMLEGRSFTNHNKLLWRYDGCIGLKTGYTDSAGRTLVSAAERDGMRLIVVTLNAPDDWNDHTALLDHGFSHYRLHTLSRAEKVVGAVEVAGALVSTVPIVTKNGVTYPLSRTESVRAAIRLERRVEGPIRRGAIAGEIVYELDGREIGRSYLIYGEDRSVERAAPNLFSRLLARWTGAVTAESRTCLMGTYLKWNAPRSGGDAAPPVRFREEEAPWKSGCKSCCPPRGSAPAGRRRNT